MDNLLWFTLELLLLNYSLVYVSGVCPDYCLSTDSECQQEADGGCPHCNASYYGRHCEYRLECYSSDTGNEYKGLVNTTGQGYQCWSWRLSPQAECPLPDCEGNYCRNLDGTVGGPWCYLPNLTPKRWQHCNVTSCRNQCGQPQLAPFQRVLNTPEPGKGFPVGYQLQISESLNCGVGKILIKTCQHNRSWIEECQEQGNITCPIPRLSTGQNIINYIGHNGSYKINYIVKISGPSNCTDGNRLRMICQADGTWREFCGEPSCPSNCTSTDCIEKDEGCLRCAEGFYGRQCQYRLECYSSNTGNEYKGLVNTTTGGHTCRPWSDVLGNRSYRQCHPPACEVNYCRNPDNTSGGPWCYPNQGGWQHCNVSMCATQCQAPPLPSGSDVVNPALPGQGFPVGYILNLTGTWTCDQTGYEPKWSLECLENKTWTAPCKRVECPVPTNVGNVNISHQQPLSVYRYGDVLHAHCNQGYTPKDVVDITCTANGSWSRNWPTCQRVECLVPTDVANVNINHQQKSSVYRYGDILHAQCNHGYTPKDVVNITCTASGSWSRNWPTCQRVECLVPTYVANVNINHQQKSSVYRYGDVLHVRCNQGYTPKDVVNITCTANGSWSRNFPICTRIECPLPTNIDNVNISHQQSSTVYRYGDVLNVHCNQGYTPKDAVDITCTTNGSWSRNWPTCQRVECPVPTSIDNVNISHQQSSLVYKYGDKLHAQCNQGYTPKDVVDITCTASGSWSRNWPTCTQITCDRTQISSNNLYVVNTNGSKFLFGKVIKFKCNEGFYTNQSTFLTCIDRNKWNGTLPTCGRKQCKAPSYMNGQVDGLKSDYYFQDKVYITCTLGYEIQGTNSSVCQANQTWSTGTSCQAVKCQIPTLQNVDSKGIDSISYNESIDLTCKEGFETFDLTTLRCRANKSLSSALPECREIEQIQPKSYTAAVAASSVIFVSFVVGVVVLILFFKRRRKTSKKKHTDKSNYGSESGFNSLEKISSNLGENMYTNQAALVSMEKKENSETLDSGEPSVTYNTYANVQKNDNDNVGVYYQFLPMTRETKNAIQVSDFEIFCQNKLKKEKEVVKEFQSFKRDLQYPTTIALKDKGNSSMNKYRNMYPYDLNRVQLDKNEFNLRTDYINASYIHGFNREKKYIAAQGPIDTSLNAFWAMVWQQESKIIVMLTNISEEGKKKCEQYWPTNEFMEFGSIGIKLLEENIFKDYTLRILEMSHNNERKPIHHLHFTVWPDRGVPRDVYPLVFLHRHVMSIMSITGKSVAPIIVHCSAGVGRTGTFIALDYLTDQANMTSYVDVQNALGLLRRQRVNMVQTAEQYRFLHEAVLASINYDKLVINMTELPHKIDLLINSKSGKKRTPIQLLFENLQKWTPTPSEDNFKTGHLEENNDKNRFSDVVPADSALVYLSANTRGNQYINAAFVSTFLRKDAFISAQTPMTTAIEDFLSIILDQNVSAIVMLDPEPDQSCCSYLPHSEPLVFGDYDVTRVQVSSSKPNAYEVSELLVKRGKTSKSVQHFKANFWKSREGVPGDTVAFLDLIQTIQRIQGDLNEDPVLVHCRNGFERTGVFCTLSVAIEKLSEANFVDVVPIILGLRNSRPQFISNLRQFQYIHEALLQFFIRDDIYQNV